MILYGSIMMAVKGAGGWNKSNDHLITVTICGSRSRCGLRGLLYDQPREQHQLRTDGGWLETQRHTPGRFPTRNFHVKPAFHILIPFRWRTRRGWINNTVTDVISKEAD
jgi:hypothetical protein